MACRVIEGRPAPTTGPSFRSAQLQSNVTLFAVSPPGTDLIEG